MYGGRKMESEGRNVCASEWTGEGVVMWGIGIEEFNVYTVGL